MLRRRFSLLGINRKISRKTGNEVNKVCQSHSGSYQGGSPCDWSGDKSLCLLILVKICSHRDLDYKQDLSYEFILVQFEGTRHYDLCLKTLRVNGSWDKSLPPN